MEKIYNYDVKVNILIYTWLVSNIVKISAINSRTLTNKIAFLRILQIPRRRFIKLRFSSFHFLAVVVDWA